MISATAGLKTAIINLYHKTPNINKADLCMSFQKTATEILTTKTFEAAKELNIDKIVLAGGVSANSYIRDQFMGLSVQEGKQIYFPELEYCTDNAAMIASAGYYNYLEGNVADLKLNAIANLKLGVN